MRTSCVVVWSVHGGQLGVVSGGCVVSGSQWGVACGSCVVSGGQWGVASGGCVVSGVWSVAVLWLALSAGQVEILSFK